MPPNAGYAVAAYVITCVVLVGYAWRLFVRARREDPSHSPVETAAPR